MSDTHIICPKCLKEVFGEHLCDKKEGKMDINDIASKHWTWVDNQGWHNKTPLEMIALIASEVGEAANECRGEQPTIKLQYELADIILRVLDMAVHEEIDIGQAISDKMKSNQSKGTKGRIY